MYVGNELALQTTKDDNCDIIYTDIEYCSNLGNRKVVYRGNCIFCDKINFNFDLYDCYTLSIT